MTAGPPTPRLLDRVRQAARLRHMSRRTEDTYVAWIRRFILFHGKRHPDSMGAPEVIAFQWLGTEQRDYHEVLEAWRTSCPRLPVWEEACNRGFVTRGYSAGRAFAGVTPEGMSFLQARRPTSECS